MLATGISIRRPPRNAEASRHSAGFRVHHGPSAAPDLPLIGDMERFNDLDIPRTLEEVLVPQHLALVVYDVQVGILNQIADSDLVLAQVRRVLDAARAARIRTFFTRHMSLPKPLMGRAQIRQAMAWQRLETATDIRSPFLRDTPPFEIVPELAPTANEAVFEKVAMSAFVGTPLDQVLRDCDVRAFAIVGVALEVGIEPTVRHGADLGYIPVLVADACGSGDPEAGDRSLASLRFAGDVLITDVDTVVQLIGRSSNPAQ